MKDWPIPMSATEIRSLLGLIEYYQTFVQDVSRIARPLTKFTRKGQRYVWIAECAASFDELKNKLITAPALKMPDRTEGIVIYSDASGRGLGVC